VNWTGSAGSWRPSGAGWPAWRGNSMRAKRR
jgi:hypothetical protein